MHYYVGKYDESRYAVPEGFAENAKGFERVSLINRATGSVHAEACIARLQAGGYINSCVHAYEKGIYVFEGAIEILRAGEIIQLATDGYALIPYATAYAIRNVGAGSARWFEILAPQPKPAAAFKDLFFTGDNSWPENAVRGPAGKGVGRFIAENPLPAQ